MPKPSNTNKLLIYQQTASFMKSGPSLTSNFAVTFSSKMQITPKKLKDKFSGCVKL